MGNGYGDHLSLHLYGLEWQEIPVNENPLVFIQILVKYYCRCQFTNIIWVSPYTCWECCFDDGGAGCYHHSDNDLPHPNIHLNADADDDPYTDANDNYDEHTQSDIDLDTFADAIALRSASAGIRDDDHQCGLQITMLVGNDARYYTVE
jgi:hypothetical protein